MTEDAIFTVPGREPFGREVFEAAAGATNAAQIDGTNEIVELQVLGDWAFTRNRIDFQISIKVAGLNSLYRTGPSSSGNSRSSRRKHHTVHSFSKTVSTSQIWSGRSALPWSNFSTASATKI